MSTPSEDFWQSLPLGEGVTILQREATGLLALNKPAGVLSHPNSADDQHRALVKAPYSLEREYFEWTPPAAPGAKPLPPHRLYLLNRLDSATSGVILAATSEGLADSIREQFKRKVIKKVYNALVFGVPSVPVQLWRDRLSIDKRGGHVRTSAAGSIPCESQMLVLRRRIGQPQMTLIKLEPRTGRSHQLRVQCAMRHLPIVGVPPMETFRPTDSLKRKVVGNDFFFTHWRRVSTTK